MNEDDKVAPSLQDIYRWSFFMGDPPVRFVSVSLDDDGKPTKQKPADKRREIRDAVRDQIGDLVRDFEGTGGSEVGRPARDLTAYDDAFASAARNCLHEDATNVLYGREWSCPTCNRSIDRSEMRRALRKRGYPDREIEYLL